jgi:hypothetical protein
LFQTTIPAMPRSRLALRAYASFHGQILIGPHPDPNQVEGEAWAELRRRCAHLDRAKLTPVRRLVPHGGLTLKVNSVDTLLPVATCSIHSLLVQCGQFREPPGHAPSSLVCGS